MTIPGFSNVETCTESKWQCASLLTRINKSQEIILTWEATAKFEQGVMSIYSTLKSLIERCSVVQETG